MKNLTPSERKTLFALIMVIVATIGTIGGIIFVLRYPWHHKFPAPPSTSGVKLNAEPNSVLPK